MSSAIPCTIELAPKQAIELQDLDRMIPAGTEVFVTDLGNDDVEETVAAAKRLRDVGLVAVPHIAARRVTTMASLHERVRRLATDAGVDNVLVIGGGLDKPAGPFDSTMALLETGILAEHGIGRVAVAGHPEGSPDFSNDEATEALRQKQAFGERTGIEMRIVTQFGFDAKAIIAWLDRLAADGIAMPVHVGVAGPATLKTLLRYAAFCGVGASMSFLKKNALKVTALARTQSPEEVVAPLEARWRSPERGPLTGLHVFPFGGTAKSSDWLRERGSWPPVGAASVASVAAE